MTARPIFSESRRSPIRVAVALCIMMVAVLMVAVLLAAGCTTKPNSDNQTGTFTPTTIPTTMQQSKNLDLNNSNHPEFLKMESNVYNQGEVVEFYVVNEGSEALTCYAMPLSFNLFRKTNNNSWEYLTEAVETKIDHLSYLKPGESTRVRRLITSDWVPGRYKIAFDCGISREFEIRAVTTMTQ
jgi:hypothetical protein